MTIVSTKQLQNGATALQVSLMFIKLLIRLNTQSISASNEFVMLNALINKVSLAAITGISVDTAALTVAIYRLFLMFVCFGEADARFFTFAAELLRADELSLNFLEYASFNDTIAGSVLLQKRRAFNFTKFMNGLINIHTDAAFVLDYTIRHAVLAKLASGNYFVFGLCADASRIIYYDSFLPIEAKRLEVQYFFIELAFFGIRLGQANRLQLLTSNYSACFSKIKRL